MCGFTGRIAIGLLLWTALTACSLKATGWSPSYASSTSETNELLKFENDDVGTNLITETDAALSRQKRFLSLLPAARARAPRCRSNDTSTIQGTCLTATTCRRFGGMPQGPGTCGIPALQRIGECCLLEVTCGGTVSTRNNTQFVHPDAPENTTMPQLCEVNVPVFNICFIRLDFTNFTIHPPIRGSCIVDQFVVPELSFSMPMLCGYNNNTHAYLDVRGQEKITLRFNLGEWTGPRRWSINIARFTCESETAPPPGCLQYYRGPREQIRSFNYNELSPNSSLMMAGLDYTVCVRREPRRCYTRWNADFFQLSAHRGNTTAKMGEQCHNATRVIINEGYDISARRITFDRFCGDSFSALAGSNKSTSVYTSSPPFQLRVKTPRHGSPDSFGTGFLLRYQQLQCLDLPVSGVIARKDTDSLAWLEKFRIW